jgi:HSP20 family protein
MFNLNKTTDQMENQEYNLVMPLSDIYESKDAYHIVLDMPGVSKDKFNVKVDKDDLVISGYRGNDDKNSKHLYNEIFYSGFHRRFIIPNNVDVDKINAHYQDGVLNLTLNKREEFKPRLIEIN